MDVCVLLAAELYGLQMMLGGSTSFMVVAQFQEYMGSMRHAQRGKYLRDVISKSERADGGRVQLNPHVTQLALPSGGFDLPPLAVEAVRNTRTGLCELQYVGGIGAAVERVEKCENVRACSFTFRASPEGMLRDLITLPEHGRLLSLQWNGCRGGVGPHSEAARQTFPQALAARLERVAALIGDLPMLPPRFRQPATLRMQVAVTTQKLTRLLQPLQMQIDVAGAVDLLVKQALAVCSCEGAPPMPAADVTTAQLTSLYLLCADFNQYRIAVERGINEQDMRWSLGLPPSGEPGDSVAETRRKRRKVRSAPRRPQRPGPKPLPRSEPTATAAGRAVRRPRTRFQSHG